MAVLTLSAEGAGMFVSRAQVWGAWTLVPLAEGGRGLPRAMIGSPQTQGAWFPARRARIQVPGCLQAGEQIHCPGL